MTAIFFYSSMAGRNTIRRTDLLTADAKDQFEKSAQKTEIVTTQPVPLVDKTTRYYIYYRSLGNPVSDDFAKQVFTLLGTLVTAVSAFYFGAKTAASAAAASKPAVSSPKLTSVDLTAVIPGAPSPLKILGSGLQLAKDVRLRKGSQEIQATGVTSNDSQVTCSITIPPPSDPAPWDVVVINSDGGTATLPGAIKA